MTVYIPFTPAVNGNPPFTTTVTLDGNNYTLTASWNLYRGDWYISLTDLNGNLIVNQPLVGSPTEASINLVGGYFTTSTLYYRQPTGNFEQTP